MTTLVPPPETRDEGDLNISLMILTRDFLQANRQRHRQKLWMTDFVTATREDEGIRGPELALLIARTTECNTAGCFAGWAALFAGWRQVFNVSTVYDPSQPENVLPVKEAARQSLGLTNDQAAALFGSNNNIFDLVTMIERLLQDQDDDLADLYDLVNRRTDLA